MNFAKACLLTLCASTLAGCAAIQVEYEYWANEEGEYSTYYKPVEGMSPEKIAELRAAPPPRLPVTEKGFQLDEQGLPADAQSRPGFIEIGRSFFYSHGLFYESIPSFIFPAAAQGKKVGADLVLVFSPRFKGTDTCQDYTTVAANDADNTTRNVWYDYGCDSYYYGAIYYIKQKN